MLQLPTGGAARATEGATGAAGARGGATGARGRATGATGGALNELHRRSYRSFTGGLQEAYMRSTRAYRTLTKS